MDYPNTIEDVYMIIIDRFECSKKEEYNTSRNNNKFIKPWTLLRITTQQSKVIKYGRREWRSSIQNFEDKLNRRPIQLVTT